MLNEESVANLEMQSEMFIPQEEDMIMIQEHNFFSGGGEGGGFPEILKEIDGVDGMAVTQRPRRPKSSNVGQRTM
jgi:hypothetical protein